MAKSELLKKLFISFKTKSESLFKEAAMQIIDDEKKKNHFVIANDLEHILFSEKPCFAHSVNRFNPDSQLSPEKESNLFEVIYPDKTLSDVVLSPENVSLVDEIIHEFLNWDVLVSNGVYPIRRVLFYGPPGCGKTMTAGAIAAEIGLPLLYIRFDSVVSSYLGETASNIRKIFDFVNGDSYVILFDEFDAIGRSRDDKYEHGEIKRVVSTFLQQIDNFKSRSLVLAATNFEKSLDYAIWRRFDSIIKFDMPDNRDKVRLFNLKLGRFRGSKTIINDYLSDLKDFSYADVEQTALSVVKNCILEGRMSYTPKDVERAVMQQKSFVSMRKTKY